MKLLIRILNNSNYGLVKTAIDNYSNKYTCAGGYFRKLCIHTILHPNFYNYFKRYYIFSQLYVVGYRVPYFRTKRS